MSRKVPEPPKPPPPPQKGGPEAKAQALQLLAEGFQLSSVARELNVNRKTVRDWRDSPEGRAFLDTARKTRADALAEGGSKARRILQDAAELAAQRLVDRLASVVPFEATTAAEAILSRIGVPRSTQVVSTEAPSIDLSKLKPEQVATLEELLRLARPDP